MKLYEAIAQNKRLEKSEVHGPKVEERQERIQSLLPRGSGFDKGTQILSVADHMIVFQTAFHHMDDHGSYCGWTDHKVIITATLVTEFSVRVTGVNKRGIKDYISDVFSSLMYREFDWLVMGLK